MLVEHSSTNTNLFGSSSLTRSRQAPLFFSSRSEAPSDFFERPAQLAHGPAHRGDRDPRLPLTLPQLAVAPKGRLVVLLELLPEHPPLLGAGADRRRASGGGLGSEIPALSSAS